MEKMKAFAVVKALIEAAEEQHADRIAGRNDETMKSLQLYCDAIDNLVEEFDGLGVSAEVLDDTLEIVVAIEGREFVSDEDSKLLGLMIMSNKAVIRPSAYGDVEIAFYFSPAWNVN